jgi:hypothetical protein
MQEMTNCGARSAGTANAPRLITHLFNIIIALDSGAERAWRLRQKCSFLQNRDR